MRFLNAIEAEVPAGKMVHVILDNYAAHKHPRSAPGSTGTSASSSTSREPHAPGSMRSRASSPGCRLKRGLFRSVVDPQVAINRFLAETNAEPKPFTWTADPDKIIAAVRRGHQALPATARRRARSSNLAAGSATPVAGDVRLARPDILPNSII